MSLSPSEKRKIIGTLIDGLDVLRDDVRDAIDSLKASDAYPPDFDSDDAIDNVIDALNCADTELQHAD